MADTKISTLTDLATADPADILPIVDIAPTPTTKKITISNLLGGIETSIGDLQAVDAVLDARVDALEAAGGGDPAAGTGWVALTDAATITSDALSNPRARFAVTLAGNRTLNGPGNPIDGAVATFRLKQDATGTRTITLATGAGHFVTPSDITVTLSTAANTTDMLSAIYVSAASRWAVIALTKGFTGL